MLQGDFQFDAASPRQASMEFFRMLWVALPVESSDTASYRDAAQSGSGERLSKLSESDRPGLIVFVVMTDGQEKFRSRKLFVFTLYGVAYE